MKDAIWATFYHYSSTDEQPHHEKCPQGSDSWCSWQKANADNKLDDYTHDYTALPEVVLTAIKPIYNDLSDDNLLERCIGGFTQNNNESINHVIWKIAPKEMHSGIKIVEIAANIGACIFNEGVRSILQIMQILDVKTGRNAHCWAESADTQRIRYAERSATRASKEARTRLTQRKKDLMKASTSREDP